MIVFGIRGRDHTCNQYGNYTMTKGSTKCYGENSRAQGLKGEGMQLYLRVRKNFTAVTSKEAKMKADRRVNHTRILGGLG